MPSVPGDYNTSPSILDTLYDLEKAGILFGESYPLHKYLYQHLELVPALNIICKELIKNSNIEKIKVFIYSDNTVWEDEDYIQD